MNTTEVVIIVLVIALIVLAGAWAYGRRKRSERLRGNFGPEYARAVEDKGDAGKAEAALHEREKRVEHYELKSISPEDQKRFADEWNRVQVLFVDSPADATAQADALLGQVMSAKGYPDGPFEQRLEDLSVKHAGAVQGYRSAHEVLQRRAEGKASTEDERRAMIDMRALFNELVGVPDAANTAGHPAAETRASETDPHTTSGLRAAS